MDVGNRLRIGSETIQVLPLSVLLYSSLVDGEILASLSIAWLFLDAELLQTSLLHLRVVTLDHARRDIVLEKGQG